MAAAWGPFKKLGLSPEMAAKFVQRRTRPEIDGSHHVLGKDVGDRWKAEESRRREAEHAQRSIEFRRMRENVLDCRSQLHNAWKTLQDNFGSASTALFESHSRES